jgi:hypothetical protein
MVMMQVYEHHLHHSNTCTIRRMTMTPTSLSSRAETSSTAVPAMRLSHLHSNLRFPRLWIAHGQRRWIGSMDTHYRVSTYRITTLQCLLQHSDTYGPPRMSSHSGCPFTFPHHSPLPPALVAMLTMHMTPHLQKLNQSYNYHAMHVFLYNYRH